MEKKEKIYLIIIHTNGEFEDLLVVKNYDYALCLYHTTGSLIYELDLLTLSLKVIK